MRLAASRFGAGAQRVLLAFALAAAADAPAEAQGQRGAPIATLLVAGPYVTVNGQPAANGMTIGSGDRVVTGPASSARLNFYRGGSVQLDANTDPDIYARDDPGFWQGLYIESQAYLRCLTRVVLNTGQIYSEGEGETSCVSHGQATMFPHSRFNLQVGPGWGVLTVASGQVAVAGVQPATVPAGTQASIAGGRIVEQRRVSPAELRQITLWRSRYAFAPPGQPAHPPQSPYPPPQSPYPPPQSPYPPPQSPYPPPQSPYPPPQSPYPPPRSPYPPQEPPPYGAPAPGPYYPFPGQSAPWPGQRGEPYPPGAGQPPPRRGDGPWHPSPAPPSTGRGGSYPGQPPRSGGDRGGDYDPNAPR